MAEFERSLIVERTSSRQAAAKACGTMFGRKPRLTPALLNYAGKRRAARHSPEAFQGKKLWSKAVLLT
ncbi:hypothetical protein [uncultured Caballeronia sp.]|uniref:hypothetical protein n=1 Tax=uncultured Caballeronia sp. TaxID=1827198 RepID=UPI0035C9FEE7